MVAVGGDLTARSWKRSMGKHCSEMWEAEALDLEVDAGVKRSERVTRTSVVSKYERRTLREMGDQAPKETGIRSGHHNPAWFRWRKAEARTGREGKHGRLLKGRSSVACQGQCVTDEGKRLKVENELCYARRFRFFLQHPSISRFPVVLDESA